MSFFDWYRKRGSRFILRRGKVLLERYNLSPKKAISRIRNCVDKMSAFGYFPTFFVPGVVIKAHRGFIRELEEKGCEIGVHGYQHIDLCSVSPEEANRQLVRALALFTELDLKCDGFRCPYLSISDGLLQELEPGLFNYSSNRAISWVNLNSNKAQKNHVFETIGGFYRPIYAESTICLPSKQDNVLEIPVCVPDDLQMRDGMGYTQDEILATYLKIFNNIQRRGELFNLMFHPELSCLLDQPFNQVLMEVQNHNYRVWVTRLRDICAWWKEKDDYKLQINRFNGKYHLVIEPQRKATLLQRGIENNLLSVYWDEKYQRILQNRMVLDKDYLPLIGISPNLQDWVRESLERKGYIVVNLEDWEDCTIKVNNEFLNGCNNPVELINSIENLDVPLIRFWAWPDGNRSALCLSGDLDALSLMDYATRLLPI